MSLALSTTTSCPMQTKNLAPFAWQGKTPTAAPPLKQHVPSLPAMHAAALLLPVKRHPPTTRTSRMLTDSKGTSMALSTCTTRALKPHCKGMQGGGWGQVLRGVKELAEGEREGEGDGWVKKRGRGLETPS